MKLTKKVLAALTALSLAATCITPIAALADYDVTDEYPTTITLPNGEVQEVPVAEPETAVSADASVAATSATEYGIYDEDDFKAITSSEWFSGSTFYIYDDLDLSGITVSEWYGVISFFYGEIISVQKSDGTYPEISGIGNNRAFIYAIAGGTIENLTFKHNASTEDGSASFITFLPTTYGGSTHKLVMNNITVTGDILLTGSDQSNYSPFVYCVSDGGITMTNCINKANITGSIYGAVFYGYYPLYVASYTFTDCVNYGDITMQYAGLFFGNSSTLDTKLNTTGFELNISGCANYGKIRGTSGANYIVAPVEGTGDYVDAVETALNTSGTTIVSAAGTITVSGITTSSTSTAKVGSLCTGTELSDFAAVLDEDDSTTIIVTRASDEDEKGVSYYIIAISTYVNYWETEYSRFNGTDRYTITETKTVTALDAAEAESTTDDVSETTELKTFKPNLKVYGFADSNNTSLTLASIIEGNFVYKDSDGNYFYMIVNDESKDYLWYTTNETDEDGNPVGNSTTDADIVTVAAYNSNGTMLDCVTVSL